MKFFGFVLMTVIIWNYFFFSHAVESNQKWMTQFSKESVASMPEMCVFL